jgi:hypothetical protein
MEESDSPTPLEHVAPVYVDVEGAYVNVEQTHGERTLYTPEEAREIATELLDAAAAAEAEQATADAEE